MSEGQQPTAGVTQALVRRRKRWSMVWFLPLLALVIGIWLLWRSYSEAGIGIVVRFQNGQGLEIGKTELRYKGLRIGVLERLEFADDLSWVDAHINVERSAEGALRHGSRFWLVKPRISLDGITGLDTLVSGNYIAIRPGDGSFAREFEADLQPPPVDVTEPGLHLTLKARSLGSLSPGAPIYYKQIKVGSVQEYRLADNFTSVELDVYIPAPYDRLVSPSTRFWNASGISIRGGLGGFNVRTESLATLLVGGIAFYTPDEQAQTPVPNGSVFTLYEDYASAEAGVPVQIRFQSAEGLVAGSTPVVYRGITLGTVQDVSLSEDLSEVAAKVLFDPRAKALLNTGTRFWLVKPSISLAGLSGLDTLLKGQYIALEPGEGEPAREFQALAEGPNLDQVEDGLTLTLKARSLGSVSAGSPVYFRRIEVGKVLGYQLSDDHEQILIEVNIRPAYSHLVNTAARFWHASGIQLSGGLSGIKLETQSLLSLISGGIAFDYLEDAKTAKAKPSTEFILYDNERVALRRGRYVQIRWDDAQGLQPGAELRWQGLKMGEVTAIQPLQNWAGVLVEVLLQPEAYSLAVEGSRFWVVKPEVALSGVQGLDTLVSGAYIRVLPGRGEAAKTFIGLAQPPVVEKEQGLRLVLVSAELGSHKAGEGVYYRGVQVGKVVRTALSHTAQDVLIEVLIEPRYANLVRQNSRFWNISGIGVDFGLFKGATIRTQSLETILAGGIAFATPPELAAKAPSGAYFNLHKEAEPTWLQWRPQIDLPGDTLGFSSPAVQEDKAEVALVKE